MEKTKEEVLLLSVSFLIEHYENGIFSTKEAADRIVFHTTEYLKGEQSERLLRFSSAWDLRHYTIGYNIHLTRRQYDNFRMDNLQPNNSWARGCLQTCVLP